MRNLDTMTKELFHEDPYMKEFDATVVEVNEYKSVRHHEIMLDKTAFYPGGCVQVGDTGAIMGKINCFSVINTLREGAKSIQTENVEIKVGGKIVHMLNGWPISWPNSSLPPEFKVGGVVHCGIYWRNRYRTMRLHSAFHIVSSVMKEVFGTIQTQGSEVNKKYAIYAFDGKDKFNPDKLEEVQEKTNDIIQQGWGIKTWTDEKISGYRYWNIEPLSSVPCDAPSIKNTKEIGKIRLKGGSEWCGRKSVEIYLIDSLLDIEPPVEDEKLVEYMRITTQYKNLPEEILNRLLIIGRTPGSKEYSHGKLCVFDIPSIDILLDPVTGIYYERIWKWWNGARIFGYNEIKPRKDSRLEGEWRIEYI